MFAEMFVFFYPVFRYHLSKNLNLLEDPEFIKTTADTFKCTEVEAIRAISRAQRVIKVDRGYQLLSNISNDPSFDKVTSTLAEEYIRVNPDMRKVLILISLHPRIQAMGKAMDQL